MRDNLCKNDASKENPSCNAHRRTCHERLREVTPDSGINVSLVVDISMNLYTIEKIRLLLKMVLCNFLIDPSSGYPK